MQSLYFHPHQAKTMGLDEAVLFAFLEQMSRCSVSSRLVLDMGKIASVFCWWDEQDIIDTLDSLQRQELLHYSITNTQLDVDFHTPIEAAPTISIPVIQSSKKYETVQPTASIQTPNQPAHPTYTQPAHTQQTHNAHSMNSVQAQNKGDFASWESFSEPQTIKEKTHIFQGWQPGNDFFTTCRNLGIEKVFALSQLPEFVLYHQNKTTLSDTWESLFMGWVKRNWASLQNSNNGSSHVQTNASNANTTVSQAANTKQQIRARISDINDTDW
jgi:hypothetical protein